MTNWHYRLSGEIVSDGSREDKDQRVTMTGLDLAYLYV